jgi:long-chain fatty acid transport protein
MRECLRLFLALFPAVSLANGYSVPNVNPRDLGLASSAVAAQRDAAAVYANPAALASIGEGPSVALTASALDIGMTWSAPVGPAEASTRRKLAPPSGAFASWGGSLGGHRVGLGAGVNSPYGGNVFWEEAWEGRFDIRSVDRKVYAAYLNGAVALTPDLRLGGGLVYYRTTEYLTQALDYGGSEGYAELSADGGRLSYQLAVEIQPAPSLRVALDYKHKATQRLEGDAAFHGVPLALRSSLPDQRVEHVLTIPNVMNLGIAWQATDALLLTGTYTFDRYKVYDEDRFVGSAGAEVRVARDYSNGHTFRAGAEYRLSPAWELRAGVLRDVSGMKPESFSPSLPDASSWGGSVGASWHLAPGMALHAALFVAIMDEVRATGDAFAGTYAIRAQILSMGFTWRPAAR